MVRLTKIYTRFGDKGQTMLGDGSTTRKTDPRVEAYGCVDEANAAVGFALAGLARDASANPAAPADATPEAVRALLTRVMNELFDVGADLCVPMQADEEPGARLRIIPAQTTWVEQQIDRFNEPMKALSSFVLPGGSEMSARLHLARTAVRKAERAAVALADAQPDVTPREALIYLNRLSDLLFVLARVFNNNGADDTLWIPGKDRNTPSS